MMMNVYSYIIFHTNFIHLPSASNITLLKKIIKILKLIFFVKRTNKCYVNCYIFILKFIRYDIDLISKRITCNVI